MSVSKHIQEHLKMGINYPPSASGGAGSIGTGVFASDKGDFIHTGNSNETTLKTVLIPAGDISLTGFIRIIHHWRFAGSGGNRLLRVKLNGVPVSFLSNGAPVFSTKTMTVVRNLDSGTQVFFPASSPSGLGIDTAVNGVATIDTTQDITLTFTGQLTDPSDSIELAHFTVEIN